MSYEKPLISIITTTWNRSKYLARVHNSLTVQSYLEFEWIVADDGSDDDTIDVVNHLAKKSRFSVIIIQSNVHIGKTRLDNEAISIARGDFIVWCDSDDYLVPYALEEFIKSWKSISYQEQMKYVGIVGLCRTKEKILNSKIINSSLFDARLIDLEYAHDMKEDSVLFLRSEILKKNRFPEVDLVVPESSVWSEIGGFQVRVLPKVVMNKEYFSDNAVSFDLKMKYNRGRAFALAIIYKNQKKYKIYLPLHKRIWQVINYCRYCIHGDLNFSGIIKLWGNNSSRLVLKTCMLPAFLLAANDNRQNKVIKTHKEFLENQEILEFTVKDANNIQLNIP